MVNANNGFRQYALEQVNKGPKITKRNVLLLTAHPDDECMFFGPAILSLRKNGNEVSVLCISSGNADGLGKIRSKELLESCSHLGIPIKQVSILNDRQVSQNILHVKIIFQKTLIIQRTTRWNVK